jgi:hypothetical protein
LTRSSPSPGVIAHRERARFQLWIALDDASRRRHGNDLCRLSARRHAGEACCAAGGSRSAKRTE